MEESINPTINIGPVTFNLTIVVLTLLTVALYFWLYLLGNSKYDFETHRKTKCIRVFI